MSDASWPAGLKKLLDEAWAYFLAVGGGITAVGLGHVPVTSAAETKPWLGLATAVGGILIACGVVGGIYQLKAWLATKVEERRVRSEKSRLPPQPDAQELANGMIVLVSGLSPAAKTLLGQVNSSHVVPASPNHPATRELLRHDLIEPTQGNNIHQLHAMLNEQTPYRLTESGLDAMTLIENALRERQR
jgi:hypothetical protein